MLTLRRSKTYVGRRPARRAPLETDKNNPSMPTLHWPKSEDFKAQNVRRQPSRNLVVIARSETDGNYYKGYITRAVQPPLNTHNVHVILQGRTTTIPAKKLLFYGGSSPWPTLKVGDGVLVEDEEKYVPATILRKPLGLIFDDTNYSVRLPSGREISVRRRDILKIGQGKFEEMKKVKLPPIKPSKEKTTESQIISDDGRSHSVDNSPPTTSSASVQSSVDKERSQVTNSGHKKNQLTHPRTPRTEVLARWSDDGWYYFGVIVRQTVETYIVSDSTGYMEEIRQKNTVDLAKDALKNIQTGDYVVALHTKYVFSYAPAVVVDVMANASFRVKFYDGLTETVPRSEMYKIAKDEYNETVKYIEQQKNGLEGRQLLARDDTTGLYHRCKVSRSTYKPHEFLLEMPYQTRQSVIHVFPRQPPAQIENREWRYVIGPLDPDCQSYLPAAITYRKPLELTFCNGEKTDEVTFDQCIYISEDYYKNAANYYRDASLKRELIEE